VTGQLGEGAMGVVLRARDTNLLRDVALKVLPEQLAGDPDRLARLQREAQVLASLNHPNIAQIYGLERIASGPRESAAAAIVMELVEGETLADRLKAGPLPVGEAIEIARQIADALAAAHDRGIVHRDLKPANIKLTSNGTVKVLDFGLAKPLAMKSADVAATAMATAIGSSVAGMIVGTVAYMSPEQARGKDVDARTDIWAFGCVLYEMLTGRLPFEGETVTDTLATIVTRQPDLSLLPATVPPAVRLLLSAMLNKNAQQRLQHVGDVRLFLDEQLMPAGGAPGDTAASTTRRGKWIAVAFVAGLAAAIVPAALVMRPQAPSPAPAMHLDVSLPGYVAAPVVSPDGLRIAYVAEPAGEKRAIWIRTLGSETAQKLAGTDNPFSGALWSPDSRFIAFDSGGKQLKRVEVSSGTIQVVCDLAEPVRGGFSWSSSGVILFGQGNGLARVPADGGPVTQVSQPDASRKETAHVVPAFLPDGQHFLYVIFNTAPENSGIYVGSLDGKTRTRLMPLGPRLNGLAYAPPGYMILAGESLTAQRFDASTLTLAGSPVPMAGAVESVSVSTTGLLLYRQVSTTAADKQLTWLDHQGRHLGPIGTPANYGNVELSPTGDRVAVDIVANGNRDVWVIDLARAVPSRISFDPGQDWTPVWSPDGNRVAYAASRNGATQIYQKASSGVGNDEPLFKLQNAIPVSWSRDGRYIVFSRLKGGAGAGVDTWLLALGGEPKASPFIESPFDKAQARISPDGRWIAYATNDSGQHQIVVQSFPDPNVGRWQITAQGGVEPKWRRDGRELYYLAFDGKMMAVPIKTEPRFEAGTPTVLFDTPLGVSRAQSPRDRRYDVAPDGRFLMAIPVANGPRPVTALVNWSSGLEKK
jgi:eukaryotic-like serine/threonine-protein kinase